MSEATAVGWAATTRERGVTVGKRSVTTEGVANDRVAKVGKSGAVVEILAGDRDTMTADSYGWGKKGGSESRKSKGGGESRGVVKRGKGVSSK